VTEVSPSQPDLTEASAPSDPSPGGANPFWTPVAAAVSLIMSGLYVAFVEYYSVNVPKGDEWVSVIPFVHESLHGQLSLGTLWTQEFNESHMFVPNLIFVASGRFDHLDTRTIMLLSALLLVTAYGLLLVLLRRYLGRKLTWLATASIGVVWFSLVDYENALWSFQIGWYLVVFFLLVTLWFLLGNWTRHPWLPFAVAVAAAVAGSCSAIQGFLIWPVGLVCLLWRAPFDSLKSYRKSALWLLGAGAVSLVYFVRYSYSAAYSGCLAPAQQCSLSFSLHHPGRATSFFLSVLGNLFAYQNEFEVHANSVYTMAHEIAGGVLLVLALLVSALMIRDRKRDPRIPLPFALIVFGLAFDLMVSAGRVGEGLPTALGSHLSMAQPIVLAGVIAYGLGALPQGYRVTQGSRTRVSVARVVLVSCLAALVVVQAAVSTGFGVVQGGHQRQQEMTEARVVANIDRIPKPKEGCEVDLTVWDNFLPPLRGLLAALPLVKILREDRLSVFAPSTYRAWTTQGPPKVAGC
jgi:hypothetical protein